MSNMFNRINDLCKQKGISIAQMCRESGVSKSCITELKSGRTNELSTASTKKLSAYFGVSVDAIATENNVDVSLDAQLSDYQYALMSEAESLSNEQIESVMKYIKFLKTEK